MTGSRLRMREPKSGMVGKATVRAPTTIRKMVPGVRMVDAIRAP